jgi:hypothetical protein
MAEDIGQMTLLMLETIYLEDIKYDKLNCNYPTSGFHHRKLFQCYPKREKEVTKGNAMSIYPE